MDSYALEPGSVTIGIDDTCDVVHGRSNWCFLTRTMMRAASCRFTFKSAWGSDADRHGAYLNYQCWQGHLPKPLHSDAVHSEMSTFAESIAAGKTAVTEAVIETCSNGQTEGQVTKLKLLKRQMPGCSAVNLQRANSVRTG